MCRFRAELPRLGVWKTGDTNGYVFKAKLVDYPSFTRTIALGDDQTLDDLHELLRAEFGWDDPHLYSFWLSGCFWDGADTEYSAPLELEETGARSAHVALRELGLAPGQRIAYLFDYGDNWQVEVTVTDIRDASGETYPQVLERQGEAPPQYAPLDEDDAE